MTWEPLDFKGCGTRRAAVPEETANAHFAPILFAMRLKSRTLVPFLI